MGIINTKCSCGKPITVRTEGDARATLRRDGKQVIYTDEPLHGGREYDIFRCNQCGKPIDETCAAAAYEHHTMDIKQ